MCLSQGVRADPRVKYLVEWSETISVASLCEKGPGRPTETPPPIWFQGRKHRDRATIDEQMKSQFRGGCSPACGRRHRHRLECRGYRNPHESQPSQTTNGISTPGRR